MAAERFVLDASVALEWFLPGGAQAASYAAEVLRLIESGESSPAVPELWHFEMASALLVAKRDRRISATRLRNAAAQLMALQPETLSIQLTASQLIDVGTRYHLQGYDAVYFELARRLKAPIASLDGGIMAACRAHGVTLLDPGVQT
jgi:predicted nucleic acid-binding protein